MSKDTNSRGKRGFLDTEMTSSDNIFAQNKLLKALLVVVLIFGSYFYVMLADIKDDYRGLILFPGSEETAEIQGKQASQRYIMMAAEFFTSSRYSATPGTVDREYSAILQFVHPTQYGRMQKELAEDAATLKALKTVSIYGDVVWGEGFTQTEIRDQSYGSLTPVFRVTFDVARSIYVGSSETPEEVENRTMAMDYIIENGRFWLLDLKVEKKR